MGAFVVFALTGTNILQIKQGAREAPYREACKAVSDELNLERPARVPSKSRGRRGSADGQLVGEVIAAARRVPRRC
jgi:hypothetical protein